MSPLSMLSDQDRENHGCFFPDYSMSVEKVQFIALAFCVREGKHGELCAEYFGVQSESLWRDLLKEARVDDQMSH